MVRKLHIKESSSKNTRISARRWGDFIDELESVTGLSVDSINRRSYEQWLTLWDDEGNEYEAEITKYMDGEYETYTDNIAMIPIIPQF